MKHLRLEVFFTITMLFQIKTSNYHIVVDEDSENYYAHKPYI